MFAQRLASWGVAVAETGQQPVRAEVIQHLLPQLPIAQVVLRVRTLRPKENLKMDTPESVKRKVEQAWAELGLHQSYDEALARNLSEQWALREQWKPRLRQQALDMLRKIENHRPYTEEEVYGLVSAVLLLTQNVTTES